MSGYDPSGGHTSLPVYARSRRRACKYARSTWLPRAGKHAPPACQRGTSMTASMTTKAEPVPTVPMIGLLVATPVPSMGS